MMLIRKIATTLLLLGLFGADALAGTPPPLPPLPPGLTAPHTGQSFRQFSSESLSSPPDNFDSSGDSSTPAFSFPPFDTNGLWLEITGVSTNGTAFNLHNATNQVYALQTTTNVPNGWNVELELWPTNSLVMPFTLQTLNRSNLFVRAEDWTGVTENGNTTPDWWFFKYFGATAFPNGALVLSDTNLDSQGNTLLYDYQNGFDPNVIAFSLAATNNYVRTSSTSVQLNIAQGTPYYLAVLVDSTNFAGASWNPYTSANAPVTLGLTEGWHDVWIGLRGLPADATPIWQWKRLKLDYTPPALILTGPSNVVSQSIIELTGYSPEALSQISYDLNNTNGVFTNQQALVLDQHYDTNTFEFTTNTFQAFDVALANGVNVFTLHATDLAGNITTSNFTITLDYSNKTNSPVVQLVWPQNGMKVCGSNFICHGWVSDPTATVTAQSINLSGNTNVFNALVGRDGDFYISDLPLNSGTNIYTLNVIGIASNATTTNLMIIQGDAGLIVDPVPSNQTTVTGQINSNTFTVWVNGVKATISSSPNGDGVYTWEADSVPIQQNGSLVQATAIPNTDNGGYGSWGNGGNQ